MLRAADSVAKTDTGRQRRDNEDNAYVRVPLFVVADGMGGAQAGEVASAMAVEEFRRQPLAPDPNHPSEQKLAERVQVANQRIYEASRTQHEHAGMGTTLTAVYVDDADLAVAHVGDSRAYVFRDGALHRLTQDHSLVEELFRRGKLTEEQAAEHPQRSIITRALGIEPDVEVDTSSYRGQAGDVVLLCSDGLTSMVDESQIATVLRSEPDLDRASERLIADANEAGGRDNITVVLFRLEDVGEQAPRPDSGCEPETVIGMTAADPAAGAGPEQRPTDPAATMTMRAAPPAEPDRTRPLHATTSDPTTRSVPRLARTQGRPGAPDGGRSSRGQSRRFKAVAALASTIIVLFLVVGGGYLATRELFFIGTNSDGIVTLYRGLPYDFIVPFYEQTYVSGLPASAIPADRRSAFLEHNLRSQGSAIALIRSAELGQISR